MMLTSDRRKGDLVKCQQLGVASYRIKSIKRRDLGEAIQSMIAREETHEESEAGGVLQSVQRTRFKVLLADDSEDNRFLIQVYVTKTPYSLDTAGNETVACEKFMAQRYDLVLMDMQMPVMDGYAATRQMRESKKKMEVAPTPIIALTAHALKEEVQKSLDAGCNAHLSKPIKKSVLLKTIDEYLNPERK